MKEMPDCKCTGVENSLLWVLKLLQSYIYCFRKRKRSSSSQACARAHTHMQTRKSRYLLRSFEFCLHVSLSLSLSLSLSISFFFWHISNFDNLWTRWRKGCENLFVTNIFWGNTVPQHFSSTVIFNSSFYHSSSPQQTKRYRLVKNVKVQIEHLQKKTSSLFTEEKF